jgi:hypothetical protein
VFRSRLELANENIGVAIFFWQDEDVRLVKKHSKNTMVCSGRQNDRQGFVEKKYGEGTLLLCGEPRFSSQRNSDQKRCILA